jgi:exodeoxyribonuclease VII large subunit
VAAVGHEVDVSIADFVADLRAATPSAAAELLVPDRGELLAQLHRRRSQLAQSWRRRRESSSQRLDQLQQRLQVQRPAARLQRGRERLLALQRTLRLQIAWSLQQRTDRRHQLGLRLAARHPRLRLAELRARLQLAAERQHATTLRQLERRVLQVRALARALNAVSPLATLGRGYAIVRDPQSGRVLRDSTGLRVGQALTVQLADGSVGVQVLGFESGPS